MQEDGLRAQINGNAKNEVDANFPPGKPLTLHGALRLL
jgi:hypothetical protein